MRKVLYCLLLMLALTSKTQAQGIEIAKDFFENLRMYVLTDSIEYVEKIEELCSLGKRISDKVFRISDEVVLALAPHYGWPASQSYTLDTYLCLIDCLIKKDSAIIGTYDFREIDLEEMAKESKKDSNVEYVSCYLKIRGRTISMDTKELIYIRNGKISLITRMPHSDKLISK